MKKVKKILSLLSSIALTMTAFSNFPAVQSSVDAAGSFDGAMLAQSSLIYNNDLAKVCAEFSHTAENESETNILKLYKQYGFSTYEAYNYGDNSSYAFSFGYSDVEVNGVETPVILVTARGSVTTEELINDYVQESNLADLANYMGFYDSTSSFFSYSVYTHIRSFELNIQSKLMDFIENECPNFYTNENSKLIITGHSLGGAAANLTAASYEVVPDYETEGVEQDNLYAYTFGAIKVKTEGKSQTVTGFENIHNIYNFYDSFGPNGQFQALGVSDPACLFGHVDNVANPGIDGQTAAGHSMDAYKAALEQNGDICTLGYSAGLEFTEYGDYAVVSDCDEEAYGVIIPDTYNGLPVTEISFSAFEDCTHLAKVAIPDSVKVIDNKAFKNCTNLKKINLPANLESIGNEAFYRCSLEKIVIPDTVEKIGKSAFANNNLKEVKLPKNLKTIEEEVFSYNGSFEKLEIPEGVTTIKKMAFYNTSIGELILPSTLTSIGEATFYQSRITNLTIPPSLNKVDQYAFSFASIQYLNITDFSAWCKIDFESGSSNPMSCSSKVLYNKKTFTSLIIPEGTTKIGNYAFYNFDQLTGISIPDSVLEIGDYAFYDCTSLTDVIVGNGVKTIGEHAFYSCTKLKAISIGNSVTEIKDSAFAGCDALTYVTLPDSLETLGQKVFANCHSLIGVDLGNKITNVPYETFYYCESLEAIEIPDTVEIIKSDAFYYCTALSTVIISDSVYEMNGCGIGYPSDKRNENLTIYGYKNSTAEEYATDYSIAFKVIAEKPEITVPIVPVDINRPDEPATTTVTTQVSGITTNTSAATTTSNKVSGSATNTAATTTSNRVTVITTNPAVTTTSNRVTETTAETTTETASGGNINWGDADLSGKVDIDDVVKILCYSADSTAFPMEAAGRKNSDVYQNGDGVSVNDAV